LERFLSSYHSIISSGLPYLVAIDGSSSTLVGYVYAHEFRLEGAYRPTAEISLYCHPDQQGRGVGTLLLEKLILALKDPLGHPELFHRDSQGKARAIKEVLSVMAVDTTGKGDGLKLKEFYERFGFVLVSIWGTVYATPELIR
jgi:GNAT superfamily N-acetyltransferase